VANTVFQAILRRSDVTVNRESYIIRNGVDSWSLAAMQALETQICNQAANAVAERKDQVSARR
jgi:hypothetical protein